MIRFARVLDCARMDPETVIQTEIGRFDRTRLLGIWRSPLAAAVRARGPASAPGDQWRGFIEALPRSGVSRCEIDQSAILDRLPWGQEPIRREEVLDYLDEFGLKIHVVQERGHTLGRPWFFFEEAGQPPRYQSTTSTDRTGSRFGVQIEPAGLFDPPQAQGRWVVRYRAPNQREDWLVLDAADPAIAARIALGHVWLHGQAGRPGGRYDDERLSGGENYREILFTIPNAYPRYHTRHFPVPNVLCHVRVTDRQDLHGQTWLHIEEIQSDWHNRRNGHPERPFRSQWLKIALSWCVQEAHERGMSGVSLTPGHVLVERNGRHRAGGLGDLYRSAERTLHQLAKATGATPTAIELCCHEAICRVRETRGGWVVVDPWNHILLHGFRNRREAEEAVEVLLKDEWLNMPALRFEEAEAGDWTRPFWRIDEQHHPVEVREQPPTREAAPSRALLDLFADLESEINDAFVQVGLDRFSALIDAMLAFEHKLKNQNLLSERTARELAEGSKRVKLTKSLYEGRRAAASEALQGLLQTLIDARYRVSSANADGPARKRRTTS